MIGEEEGDNPKAFPFSVTGHPHHAVGRWISSCYNMNTLLLRRMLMQRASIRLFPVINRDANANARWGGRSLVLCGAC